MRYVLYSALGGIFATLLFVAFVNLRDVRRKEQFAHNGRRLARVAQMLEKERPFPLASVHNVLARHLGSDGLEDAWGRPFEIALLQDPSGIRHYVVRSLGADGMEGPCFTEPGSTSYELDCDWVAVDGMLVSQYPN
jgi:hypothetical protein